MNSREPNLRGHQVSVDKPLNNLDVPAVLPTVEEIAQSVNSRLARPFKLSVKGTTVTIGSSGPFALNNGQSIQFAPIGGNMIIHPSEDFDLLTGTFTGTGTSSSLPVLVPNKFYAIGFQVTAEASVLYELGSVADSKLEAFDPDHAPLLKESPIGMIAFETNSSGVPMTLQSSDIIEFLLGGSGGGSGGSGNPFEENLKLLLNTSKYQYMSGAYFEEAEDSLSNPISTASLSGGVYEFKNVGDTFVSTQLLLPAFLATPNPVSSVDLYARWLDDVSTDSNATYEVALDGINYNAISMTRQPGTNTFGGNIRLTDPTNSTVSTQATSDTTRELNSTTAKQISRLITITEKICVRQLNYMLTKAGNPAGSYAISIQTDNAGVPGDVLISESRLISTLSVGVNSLTFSGFKTILAPGSYWLTVQVDTFYQASFVTSTTALSLSTTAASTGLIYNGTTWTASAGYAQRYTLLGYKFNLTVRITGSSVGNKLEAFGVLFDERIIYTRKSPSVEFIQVDGDVNPNVFTLKNFLPDPNRLRIYDSATGQVYVWPAFNIDGSNITFPVNTFSVPASKFFLLFDQSAGGTIDNSDANLALLTANHLASTDPNISKGVTGRGIILKRKVDGLLREIIIDENDIVRVITVP